MLQYYMINFYVRFLHFIQAVQNATPEWPALDAKEERAFNHLVRNWDDDKSITVSEYASMMTDVSPGTAHSQINQLIKKGIIYTVPDPTDGRIKLIQLTQLTINYLKKFDNANIL